MALHALSHPSDLTATYSPHLLLQTLCSRNSDCPSSKSSFCSCLRALVLVVPSGWNGYRPCLPPGWLLVIHFKSHLFWGRHRSLCVELYFPHRHTHTALNLITLLYLLFFFLAASSLSCSMWALSRGAQAFLTREKLLSCSGACRILVPRLGITHAPCSGSMES